MEYEVPVYDTEVKEMCIKNLTELAPRILKTAKNRKVTQMEKLVEACLDEEKSKERQQGNGKKNCSYRESRYSQQAIAQLWHYTTSQESCFVSSKKLININNS